MSGAGGSGTGALEGGAVLVTKRSARPHLRPQLSGQRVDGQGQATAFPRPAKVGLLASFGVAAPVATPSEGPSRPRSKAVGPAVPGGGAPCAVCEQCALCGPFPPLPKGDRKRYCVPMHGTAQIRTHKH